MAWLEWYNFIFLAPFLAGVVTAISVVATGAMGAGDADSHTDGDGHGEKGLDLLGWFGIGRGLPLSLMLTVLFFTFGLSGLGLNLLLEPILRFPVIFAPVAALGALFASSLVSRAFAKALKNLTDVNRKTSIKSAADLVGCTGNTVFEVNDSHGAANIKDNFGNIHRVSVRSQHPLNANLPVRVIRAENGIYLVEEIK
jgi:membrane protein implicated in regulation of membrane protease activity